MKPVTRRSVMAGTAASAAALPALALPEFTAAAEDVELRRLWTEYVEIWNALQLACTNEHKARIAAYADKKRLPSVWTYQHIVPADARARRRWVAVERRHPFVTGIGSAIRKSKKGQSPGSCRALRQSISQSNASTQSSRSGDASEE